MLKIITIITKEQNAIFVCIQNLAGVKTFNDYYKGYYYPQYADIWYMGYPDSHQEISHAGRTTHRYKYITRNDNYCKIITKLKLKPGRMLESKRSVLFLF